ncbi:hypothetical protein [Streptomyces hydrogenans]|uniref:hypothetical protein n=1 Tax=Streptomyces hydrogenans TaxID=1873719 RepID=UPI0005B8C869
MDGAELPRCHDHPPLGGAAQDNAATDTPPLIGRMPTAGENGIGFELARQLAERGYDLPDGAATPARSRGA